MTSGWVGVVLLLLAVSAEAQASSSMYYVNYTSSYDDPSQCGRNWTTACSSLASGVIAACSNTTTDSSWLWVAPGTYPIGETLTIPCALHLRSIQGRNDTIIVVNETMRSASIQYQAAAGNASLHGFSVQTTTSRMWSSWLLDVQGPYDEMWIRDLVLANSTWQALGHVDQVRHLLVEDIFLSQLRFTDTPLRVLRSERVDVEGWEGVDVHMRTTNLTASLALFSIAANENVSIRNVTVVGGHWGGRTSQAFYIEGSPQLTLAHIVLDSLASTHMLSGVLPQNSSINLEDIRIEYSEFESHAVKLQASVQDTVSLGWTLSGYTLRNVTTLGNFFSLQGNFSTIQTEWSGLLWQDIAVQSFLELGEGLVSLNASFTDWNITTATVSTVFTGNSTEGAFITASDLLWTDLTSQSPGDLSALWTWDGDLSQILMERITLSNSTVGLFSLSGVSLTLSDSTVRYIETDTIILWNNCQANFRSVLFAGNQVVGSGITAFDSTISLQSVSFLNNTGDPILSPGFVFFKRCNFDINGTISGVNFFVGSSVFSFRSSTGTFSHSHLRENEGYLGGSIYQNQGRLTVSNNVFGNDGGHLGGVVHVQSGEILLDHNMFIKCGGGTGGVIFVAQSNMTMSDCAMLNCSARGGGGSVYGQASHLNITEVAFNNGFAAGGGGAVHVVEGSLYMSNAVFRSTGSASSGGAVLVDLAQADIHNSIFVANHATLRGGDISSMSGVVSVTNSTFAQSRGEISAGSLWAQNSRILLTDCSFNDTFTRTSGGAMEVVGGTCAIGGCRFLDSSSYLVGGALHLSSTITNISTTFFSRCRSFEGGAIYVEGGEGSVSDSQFDDCHALQVGGGMHLNSSGTWQISSTQFTECSAQIGGALSASNVTIDGYDIHVNRSRAAGGGGFALDNTSAQLNQVSLSECNATVGGGMLLEGQSNIQANGLSITRCLVSSLSGGEGGGIHMLSTSFLNATDALLADNEATSGGALCLQESARVVLLGSTLRYNRATLGGAITLSYSSQLTLAQNTLLQGNEAAREGGAISADTRAEITIQHSTLQDNRVTQAGLGGAISLRDDVILQVNDTLFLNNTATGGGAVATADLQACQAVLHFSNTTMSQNAAAYGGGAFLASSVQATLGDLHCLNNQADLEGGCLYALGSQVILVNAQVEGNMASRGGAYWVGDQTRLLDDGSSLRYNHALEGGALFLQGGATILQNLTVDSNNAADQGGGLSLTLPTAFLLLSQSTIHSNSAPQGGGLMITGTPTGRGNDTSREFGIVPSSPSVENCTISNNTATQGGGMYVEHLADGVPWFANCTWRANQASSFGAAMFVQGASSLWPVRQLSLSIGQLQIITA